MDDLSLEIGKRLTEIRKKNNKTQQEVVDNIEGLTVQMLSSYENGKQKPGIENMIKLSNFFNVSLDYLCLGIKTQTTRLEITNYEDLIRCIIAIVDTGIFNINSYSWDNYGITQNVYNLESKDYNLVWFQQNIDKLYAAKHIIGDEMYNISLEGLIKKYKDLPIEKNKGTKK